jgi:small subunit ribosomal protein S16
MVRIRLSRIGKKHVPFFRLIAIDGRQKRDGAELANIGTYDVLKGQIVRFDEALYNDWINKGAQVSDSAKRVYNLYRRQGVVVSQAPKQVVAFVPEVVVENHSIVQMSEATQESAAAAEKAPSKK